MKAKKMQIMNLIMRIGLFTLILSLGTMAALAMGETEGFALADLAGASIRTVAASVRSDVLYAGLTDGRQPAGVYRSNDNGRTWRRVSSGPAGLPIDALAVHPANDATIYAGTAGGPAATTDSLWGSNDGGQTWHQFTIGLPSSPDGLLPAVTVLATDPNRSDVLYVGTDGRGVYRFYTGLQSFGFDLIGGRSLYDAHVNSLVVGPDSRAYVLTNDGLFMITDGYASHRLPLPEMAVSLAVAPDAQTLYVGCVSTGAYRTTDGGQTWETINNGLEMVPGAALRVTALAIEEQDLSHVVAATAYGVGGQLVPWGIYESRDAGRSWTKLAEADAVVTQLSINQGVISAVKANGLARYREPIRPTPTIALPSLWSLANPSGTQVLVLILTVGLAGLALVGRMEWVLRRGQSTA